MNFVVVETANNHVFYSFSNCSREELDNRLNLFFTAEGYKYKRESENGKIYVKGNQVLRVILGAFWKYFKILLLVRPQGDTFSVLVKRDASGFMGGVFGVMQVQKEFSKINEAFKTYFSDQQTQSPIAHHPPPPPPPHA